MGRGVDLHWWEVLERPPSVKEQIKDMKDLARDLKAKPEPILPRRVIRTDK